MDKLQLIPQVFFDLIARVIPGAAGIVACLLLSNTTWESALNNTLGASFTTNSSTLGFLIFLAASYVAGQVISPAAKLIQRLGESVSLSWLAECIRKLGDAMPDSWAAKSIRRLAKSVPLQKLADKRNGAYDRLRLRHAESGALCAKIRAEFTMHNGLSAVLFFSAVLYPLRGKEWHWLMLCVLFFGALLTAFRGRTTRDTYNETVIKFDDASQEGPTAPQKQSHAPEPAGRPV